MIRYFKDENADENEKTGRMTALSGMNNVYQKRPLLPPWLEPEELV